MSLLPLLVQRQGVHRLLDDVFDLDLVSCRPWMKRLARRHAAAEDAVSSIAADANQFQVSLDVQHFSPEELSVKTVDGHVVVEGVHEEKEDEHGFVSRRFVRRYALPADCDPECVQSRVSIDGVLTVSAPRRGAPLAEGERFVPIARTGPVRLARRSVNGIKPCTLKRPGQLSARKSRRHVDYDSTV